MSSKKILLVEGRDDEHVIKALFGRRSLPHLTDIRSHGGVDNLLESLSVRIKESGISSLGVVVDADTDLQSRWTAIRDRLVMAGYTSIPSLPEPNGVVLSPPNNSLLPRLGVWLMPNNLLNGILEDFVRFLVPASDLLIKHAETSLARLPQPLKFIPTAYSKALIHTWLAWQTDPGRPLGQAITARFLDHDVPEADIFVEWINRVFFLDAENSWDLTV